MALFASQTLARIPASFFGMVLGLAGLAGDWRIAHVAWSLPAAIGEAMYLVASITWLIIATLYALKWILAPGEAKAESVHAVSAVSSDSQALRRCSSHREFCLTRALRPSRYSWLAVRSRLFSPCGVPAFSGVAIVIP